MSKALVVKGADFRANRLTTVNLETSVPCTGLSISESSLSFTSLGTTQTIIATVVPSDTTDVLIWESSDTSVATVSGNGTVTSVGAGAATITATCGTQTASCSVSVVDEPEYVLVSGYNPSRRSAAGHAATLGATTGLKPHVLAANNSDPSLYPIEDKDDVDTGDWNFVPLHFPAGATGFTVTSEYEMKSRILWFDNTKVSDTNARGAWVVAGNVSANYDQDNWTTTITLSKPADAGINSFGGCIYFRSHEASAVNVNDAEDIAITYTYE